MGSVELIEKGNRGMESEMNILETLETEGLDAAIVAAEDHPRELRLFLVCCAREVQHLMKDQRSLDALDVAEKYARGEATDEELIAACYAASDAAWDASDAAGEAEWYAARAAWDAAKAASEDAAAVVVVVAAALVAAGAAKAAAEYATDAEDAALECQTEIFREVFKDIGEQK